MVSTIVGVSTSVSYIGLLSLMNLCGAVEEMIDAGEADKLSAVSPRLIPILFCRRSHIFAFVSDNLGHSF